MKKNVIKIVGIMGIVIALSACGNLDSKVDDVIISQMLEADSKEDKSEVIKEQEPDTIKASEKVIKEENSTSQTDDDIDVDLTKLSSTMVYSEVYNMMYAPEDYIGKIVKMNGTFVIYLNEDETQFYPAVIIQDATACCSQGIEFLLEGNPPYPEGYPELKTDITVIGTFEIYEEDDYLFCRLQNAKIQ